MTDLITFEQAIVDSRLFSKRHLLLGNGFSIACRPDIFHYASLFDEADFSRIPNVRALFARLGTQDFEIVIRTLESGAIVLDVYDPAQAALAGAMRADAAALKGILVSTVAQNHPNIPLDIADEKFENCRKFLSNFLGGQTTGCVFTLNYDLLLYWTLMHDGTPFGAAITLNASDGFGNDEDDPDTDYVVWQGETRAHSASVHFLHGALHLFDAGHELQKYTWVRRQERLVDQARAAINTDKYPLFVSEGTSSQKLSKIRHNAYLYQGLKVLAANADQGRHCFFIYGHSLADSDDHILRRLGRGRFPKLYVSLYGDPDSDANKAIVEKANRLAGLRNVRHPLEVSFYDAASARVWG
jgi:hypothetical protein